MILAHRLSSGLDQFGHNLTAVRNQIRSGLVSHSMIRTVFGRTEPNRMWDTGSGAVPFCQTQARRFLHTGVFFLTGSVLPQPDSHSEPNRIWDGFDLILDGLVRLWPRGSVLEANRCAEIIGPGSGKMELARFQFPASSVARIILCDTGLDLIWFRMAMSRCVQTDLFWKQAGVQESSSWFRQNATGPLPVSLHPMRFCFSTNSLNHAVRFGS